MVIHLLLQVLYFLLFDFVAGKATLIHFVRLEFFAHFFGTPFLDFVQLLRQLCFLLVVCKLFVGPGDICFESLLAHLLVVDELLGQVMPFEAG